MPQRPILPAVLMLAVGLTLPALAQTPPGHPSGSPTEAPTGAAPKTPAETANQKDTAPPMSAMAMMRLPVSRQTETTIKPPMEISVAWPKTEMPALDADLRRTVAAVRQVFTEHVRHGDRLMRDAARHAGGTGPGKVPYMLSMDYDVTRNDGRTFSVLFRVTTVEGGGTSLTGYVGRTYDAGTGRRLPVTFSHVIRPGHTAAARRALAEAWQRQHPEEPVPETLAKLDLDRSAATVIAGHSVLFAFRQCLVAACARAVWLAVPQETLLPHMTADMAERVTYDPWWDALGTLQDHETNGETNGETTGVTAPARPPSQP